MSKAEKTVVTPCYVTMDAEQAEASLTNLGQLIVAGLRVQDAKDAIVTWATEQATGIHEGGFSRAACLTALVDYKIGEYGELEEAQQMDSIELGYYVQTDAGEIKVGSDLRRWVRAGVTAVYGTPASNRKKWVNEPELAGVIAYFVAKGLRPEAAEAAATVIVADKDSRLQVRKAA